MERLEALDAWLGRTLGGREFTREPASADASFRRYFRVCSGDRTWIAMDAPPEREDCRPFVKVAGLMREAGVHVPEIVAQDLAQGFLLLSDLGRRTYLQAFDGTNEEALFRDATGALVDWQAASREGELPPYDEALLRRELALFPDWFVARHLGVTLDAAERESLEQVFRRILERNLAEPRVFVHRDFMPRNLMVSEPNPGVLDFQDAVHGPISYDIASLWRDAFVTWEEERVLDGTIRYWEAARKRGLPVRADFGEFWRDVEWMGLQRHLKVLGIFARIHYRDGKPGYLGDTPRFLAYVRHACARYGELRPLARLLDRLEGVKPVAGYTF
ncbi:MAG TPA: phosphotransferase [Usitatibacteraceae bacterium]|nr:phosphotransferase [Usitatibacteraceae bacterium]